MMAQVQQEDLELLEERYAQQQSLIEELKEEVAEHDSEQEEIDRLKREAAKLRAAQEAQEKKREDIQAQFKKRLNEREAKDDKGSEL
jgi:predicted nuclease with TOPRIM domain